MTDDRELLRLVAIACGELIDEWKNNEAFFDGVLSRWNPLEDSGDALQLATYMRFTIKITDHAITIFDMNGECLASILVFAQDIENVSSTVRRAIVRAAANVGADILQEGYS